MTTITRCEYVAAEESSQVNPNVVWVVKNMNTKAFLKLHGGEAHWGTLKEATLFDNRADVITLVMNELDYLNERFSICDLECRI